MTNVPLSKLVLFPTDLWEAVHNFNTHTFKLLVTDAINPATAINKSDVTEAGGPGYTAGGNTVTATLTNVAGLFTVFFTNTSWTATGAWTNFRYFVLYNATVNRLVAYYDYGTEIAMVNGSTINFNFDGVNGAIQFQ